MATIILISALLSSEPITASSSRLSPAQPSHGSVADPRARLFSGIPNSKPYDQGPPRYFAYSPLKRTGVDIRSDREPTSLNFVVMGRHGGFAVMIAT